MAQITKQRFCKMINRIATQKRIAEEMEDAFAKYHEHHDFFDPNCLFDCNLDFVVDLLETMFDDEKEWISSWVLRNDCNPVCFADGDNEFYINNAEDLYELVANKKFNYCE